MYKKIILLIGVDGLIKGLGLLTIPIYLGLMSKENFGEFSFYFSAATLIIPILTISLFVPQIKSFTETSDLEKKRLIFTSTIFAVTIFTGVVILILSLTNIGQYIFNFVFGIQENRRLKYYLFVFLIYVGAINLVIYAHTMATMSGKAIALYNLLKLLAHNIFPLFFLNVGAGFSNATIDRLIGLAVGEFIFVGIYIYWCSKEYLICSIDIDYLKEALRIGLKLMPSSVASLVILMTDRFFLGKYHGMDQLAEYNLALLLIAPAQIIVASSQTTWTPYIFSLTSNNEAYNQSLNLMWKMLIGIVIVMFGISVLVLISKNYKIIPSNYQDIEWLILLLSISVTASALVNIPNNLLMRFKNFKFISIISWLGVTLTVISGYIFTRPYGYKAAVISAIIIQTILLILTWIITKVKLENLNK